jgi:hypothetical protein
MNLLERGDARRQLEELLSVLHFHCYRHKLIAPIRLRTHITGRKRCILIVHKQTIKRKRMYKKLYFTGIHLSKMNGFSVGGHTSFLECLGKSRMRVACPS